MSDTEARKPAASLRIIGNMQCVALSEEQSANTCGNYRYLVQWSAMAHTAFRSRQDLERWLSERGLSCCVPEPLEAGHCGQWRSNRAPIVGTYGESMHWDEAEFYALPAVVRSRDMSNGDWVDALITEVEGMRIVNTLNPNVKGRRTFAAGE